MLIRAKLEKLEPIYGFSGISGNLAEVDIYKGGPRSGATEYRLQRGTSGGRYEGVERAFRVPGVTLSGAACQRRVAWAGKPQGDRLPPPSTIIMKKNTRLSPERSEGEAVWARE